MRAFAHANPQCQRGLHPLVHRKVFTALGAMLLAVWRGSPHRPTQDLDLLGFGDPSADRLIRVFQDLCAQNVENDGWIFDPQSVTAEPIRTIDEYGGMRVHLDEQCVERQESRAREMQRAKADLHHEHFALRNNLLQDVNNWHDAERIRAYLNRIEEQIKAGEMKISNAQQFERWIKWARWYAADIDPLVKAPPWEQPAIMPTNTPADQLDLTQRTRRVIESLSVQDTDSLAQLKPKQMRAAAEYNTPVWDEIIVASHPLTRARVAMGMESGGVVFTDGLDASPVAEGLDFPLLSFTRGGALIAAAKSEIRIYRFDGKRPECRGACTGFGFDAQTEGGAVLPTDRMDHVALISPDGKVQILSVEGY